MENIKAKCINIVLAENRSQVILTVTTKEKKVQTHIAITFDNAKDGVKFEIGKEYTITVK